jgi:hypothetical protein
MQKEIPTSLFLHHGSSQTLEYQGSNQGPLKYEVHLKPQRHDVQIAWIEEGSGSVQGMFLVFKTRMFDWWSCEARSAESAPPLESRSPLRSAASSPSAKLSRDLPNKTLTAKHTILTAIILKLSIPNRRFHRCTWRCQQTAGRGPARDRQLSMAV